MHPLVPSPEPEPEPEAGPGPGAWETSACYVDLATLHITGYQDLTAPAPAPPPAQGDCCKTPRTPRTPRDPFLTPSPRKHARSLPSTPVAPRKRPLVRSVSETTILDGDTPEIQRLDLDLDLDLTPPRRRGTPFVAAGAEAEDEET